MGNGDIFLSLLAASLLACSFLFVLITSGETFLFLSCRVGSFYFTLLSIQFEKFCPTYVSDSSRLVSNAYNVDLKS